MLLALRLVRLTLSLVGLPVVGCYLSTLIVKNPPLVAPFLLTSPFYAMMVCGGIFSRFGMQDWGKKSQPVPTSESDLFTEKYPEILGQYEGRLAFADHDLSYSACMIWKSGLLIDKKIWRSLSAPGREFLLVRAAYQLKRPWFSEPLKVVGFLAAHILACINLWLVIPLHVGFAATIAVIAVIAVRRSGTWDSDRDRNTLRITRSYSGAKEYLKTLPINDMGDRLATLKQSAVDLGLA